MTLVKQQADELDVLKRISLNLTSSLDLQTVLETVVTEAIQLKNSHATHIYLYSHGELEFGAALNSCRRELSTAYCCAKIRWAYSSGGPEWYAHHYRKSSWSTPFI